MPGPDLIVRQLGVLDYVPVWRGMQMFTRARGNSDGDELWILQHRPVFTLGQAGRREHIHGDTAGIPIIKVDRGGQVTYHGPGQVIVYTLIDLRRRKLAVRGLVTSLEQATITLLANLGIAATARAGAPGVYVGERKIAALGLRVSAGRSYHGLSLNVAMDLAPFALIDPCGYRGLQVTQLSELGITLGVERLGRMLSDELLAQLGYNSHTSTKQLPDALRRHEQGV
ncbi:MAG: lipoyl(octanoyl) transferase LipB [Gammaproteobacteria bacterium]|nr:lipoyl(octanoyl) transferase LipB [Gammaproteobacteria bacterium]